MKIKTAMVAAAILAAAPALHAFSLDFSSTPLGTTISPDLVINIPGYGDVSFSAGFNSVTGTSSSFTVANNILGVPAIQFDNGDTLIVTFLGAVPTDVDFLPIGISAGSGSTSDERFVKLQPLVNQFVLTLENSSDGAALASVSTSNTVPEPTSAVLGLLGAAGFAFRRRR